MRFSILSRAKSTKLNVVYFVEIREYFAFELAAIAFMATVELRAGTAITLQPIT